MQILITPEGQVGVGAAYRSGRADSKQQQVFCLLWVLFVCFQEYVFKEKRGRFMLGEWTVLIGYVSQCIQIMRFDCWNLLFCFRNKSVTK